MSEKHHAKRTIKLSRSRRIGTLRQDAPQLNRTLIEAIVARVFEVTLDDIKGSSRGRARIARARQVAMYLAHVTLHMSMTDVGRMFDRDRTTVKHACAVIEDRRDDDAFNRALQQLEDIVSHLAVIQKSVRSSWVKPIQVFEQHTN